MSNQINIVIADKNLDTKVLNGLIVKSEVNANTIEIEFPKIYDGENLESKIFVIKTINANGVYFEEILPKTIAENKITLTWKIGSEYTSVSGDLRVAIFAEGTNYVLGTKTAKVFIENSPQFTAPISPEDVFEKYLKEIRVRSESASNSAEQSLKILTDMNSKIVDDFTSTAKDKALSANKGRELNTRINNIVGQTGTSNTEIVDARNSPERNTIYPTLKARLDAVDGDIVKSKFSAPTTATAPITTLPSTAVKGKMEGSLKGNTLYQAIVGGENQPTGTTKSFIALNGVKYFLLPSKTIITGTGISVNVTNSTGANANIMAVQLTTPYENWTADQLNNLINGYWEGLGNSKASKAKAVGKNLLKTNLMDWEQGTINPTTGFLETNLTAIRTSSFVKLKQGTYRISSNPLFFLGVRVYDKNKIFTRNVSASTITISGQEEFIKIVCILNAGGNIRIEDIEKVQPMLNEGSTALPYEPYTETELFCPVELGSVPNGTADEFTFDGKHIQRTKEYTLQSRDISGLITTTVNINIAIFNSPEGRNPVSDISGKIIITDKTSPLNGGELDSLESIWKHYCSPANCAIILPKTITTLEQAKTALAGTKIRYQLATPVEIQYPASNLIAEPSGTIYVDSVIKVVKPYKTNITLDVKIKNLINVTKVDGENRVPILLSLVNVASDGMSLTILNASSGDMYELEYEIFGATLPTVEYSYPSNLNAQIQSNTEQLKNTDKILQDFLAYQNAVNAQVDLRLVLLERK